MRARCVDRGLWSPVFEWPGTRFRFEFGPGVRYDKYTDNASKPSRWVMPPGLMHGS